MVFDKKLQTLFPTQLLFLRTRWENANTQVDADEQMSREDVSKDSQRGHGEVRKEDEKRRKGVGRGQLMRKRQ